MRRYLLYGWNSNETGHIPCCSRVFDEFVYAKSRRFMASCVAAESVPYAGATSDSYLNLFCTRPIFDRIGSRMNRVQHSIKLSRI